MHIAAHLDVELVAVEQTDELTVMLELLAPTPPATGERPPATIEVVLDRSGSMAEDGRMLAARGALHALVDRLDPRDAFGLVAFDHEVEVVVPAAKVVDKAAIHAAIAPLHPRGATNLSGGLLRGFQEARRSSRGGPATLILLSDGMANHGVTDAARLRGVAEAAQRAGVTASTVGIGVGYDDTLLAAIAAGGQGDHVFAEHADTAAAAVASQVDGLLSTAVQAASLVVWPTADVETVTVFNDLPSAGVEGGIMVELGDLWAGERRRLLLGLGVPAIPTLGLAQVATLELRYVAVPELSEQTITLPVSVNVVPGDQAAGRVPDPKVRTELLFQQAQEAKRRAADAIARGEHDHAMSMLDTASATLAGVDEAERAVLADLATDIRTGSAARAAKRSRMEHHDKSRRRGRDL